LFVLGCLERHLWTDSNVSLVIVDSLNAFYWHDRYVHPDSKSISISIRNKLATLAEKYHFSTILTFQDLFRQRFVFQNPNLGRLNVKRLVIVHSNAGEYTLNVSSEEGGDSTDAKMKHSLETGLEVQ